MGSGLLHPEPTCAHTRDADEGWIATGACTKAENTLRQCQHEGENTAVALWSMLARQCWLQQPDVHLTCMDLPMSNGTDSLCIWYASLMK